jgi:hypothetical protein
MPVEYDAAETLVAAECGHQALRDWSVVPPDIDRRGSMIPSIPSAALRVVRASARPVTRPLCGCSEVFGDCCGDFEEASPRFRRHFIPHVDNATRAQVGIKRYFEHRLAAACELLRQDNAGASVRVPIRIIEHHYCAVQ